MPPVSAGVRIERPVFPPGTARCIAAIGPGLGPTCGDGIWNPRPPWGMVNVRPAPGITRPCELPRPPGIRRDAIPAAADTPGIPRPDTAPVNPFNAFPTNENRPGSPLNCCLNTTDTVDRTFLPTDLRYRCHRRCRIAPGCGGGFRCDEDWECSRLHVHGHDARGRFCDGRKNRN